MAQNFTSVAGTSAGTLGATVAGACAAVGTALSWPTRPVDFSICVALVVFASWRPGKALLGALLFAFFDALQLRLQVGSDLIPYQLFQMIPYVMTLIALTIFGSKIAGPKSKGKPYYREER